MKLNNFYKTFKNIKEIKVIGKSRVIEGVSYNVMGVCINEGKLQLLILEYDDKLEAKECSYCEEKIAHVTNRMRKKEVFWSRNFIFTSLEEVIIGNQSYKTSGLSSGRLDTEDWETMLILSRFMSCGWKPKNLGKENLDTLFLTTINLGEGFESIPNFGKNPKLEFIKNKRTETVIVEKPIELVIGKEYKDKIYFTDKETGEKHWILINKVSMHDVWNELSKSFERPDIKERFTEKEILKHKKSFEKDVAVVCPKGMFFPLVEYEKCDNDKGISIEFHSTDWLDKEHINRGFSMVFFVKSDEPKGVLGLPLESSLIYEPMPKDTLTFKAELYSFNKRIANESIIL